MKVTGIINIPENRILNFTIGENGEDRPQEDTPCYSNLYNTYTGTQGSQGSISYLMINGNIIFNLNGGYGGNGAHKRNGSGATDASPANNGSLSTTSSYDESPVIIFSTSTVFSATPFLRIKY